MTEPRQLHRGTTRLLSSLMIVLGIAMLAVTIGAGGGVLARGVLLGILFVVAGSARLYLQSRVGRS
jgi:hypothetical protein